MSGELRAKHAVSSEGDFRPNASLVARSSLLTAVVRTTEKPLARRGFDSLEYLRLFRLIQRDSRGLLRLLFGPDFPHFHDLVRPLIGGFGIGCTLLRRIALSVCPFAIHKIQVGHCVIVVGPQLYSFI